MALMIQCCSVNLYIDDYELRFARQANHDTSGALHYIRCCEELGVVPVKFFLRNYREKTFVMRYHGLGSLGAQALCVPLEVRAPLAPFYVLFANLNSYGPFLSKLLR